MHKRRTHSAYAIFSDVCLLKPKRRADYLRHHVKLMHRYAMSLPHAETCFTLVLGVRFALGHLTRAKY